jgi:hypothetical protein
MSLTAVSRDTLRGLKAKKEEAMRALAERQRLDHISQMVRDIYVHAVSMAEISSETVYKYKVNTNQPFMQQNMSDILNGLKTLFPDCTVEHSFFVRGNDGQMYDISKMDEKMRPFINPQNGQSTIVIDWS